MKAKWKWLSCLMVVLVAVVAFASGLQSINPVNYAGGGTQPTGNIDPNVAIGSPSDPVAWAIPPVPGNVLHLHFLGGMTATLTQSVDDEGNLCYIRPGYYIPGPPPRYVPSMTAYFWNDGTFTLWVGGTTNTNPGATYTQD